MKTSWFFLCLLWPLWTQSQSFQFKREGVVKVKVRGKELTNAWSGGLNAPQFSTLHLNADSIPDLAVFDRTNNHLTTFLAVRTNGAYTYQLAPAYESLFPSLRYWVLLADYDHDGRKDIFTHTRLGITVYHNTTGANGLLSWNIASNALYSQTVSGNVNLQVGAGDIPAIIDVDNDGDLDILTYDFLGSYVEYHQNQSMEKYGHANRLEFKRVNPCWGNFEEGTTCGDFDFNVNCQTTGFLEVYPPTDAFIADNQERGSNLMRIQHAGSTILALDLDGDRDKDLLVGDVSCESIFRMINQGTTQQAIFKEADTTFPVSKPIQFPVFPATYYEDVNFDGVKDLLASPNAFVNEGGQINFRESVWLYPNMGSDSVSAFQFQQPDFLQSIMIDLGENAAPTFADYDADGDQDLFVGHAGLLQKDVLVATVFLFENTGTAKVPLFELRTDDYLQLSAFHLTNLKPLFADVNLDGRVDFCFAGNSGPHTEFRCMLNTAPRRKPFRLNPGKAFSIPVRLDVHDAPCLSDLDADGDVDLLVGKLSGNLAIYQNTGTVKKPVFTLESQQFGGIEPSSSNRNLALAVADLNGDGRLELLTGNRQGELRIYQEWMNNPLGFPEPVTDFLWDEMHQRKAVSNVGALLYPAAADLNGDGLAEIVVGTNAGGLVFLGNAGITKP